MLLERPYCSKDLLLHSFSLMLSKPCYIFFLHERFPSITRKVICQPNLLLYIHPTTKLKKKKKKKKKKMKKKKKKKKKKAIIRKKTCYEENKMHQILNECNLQSLTQLYRQLSLRFLTRSAF